MIISMSVLYRKLAYINIQNWIFLYFHLQHPKMDEYWAPIIIHFWNATLPARLGVSRHEG